MIENRKTEDRRQRTELLPHRSRGILRSPRRPLASSR
jgi:hypothetical protein